MSQSPVVVGLAAVFVGLTTLLLLVAVATGSAFVLVVAVPLGITAAIMWYHATGRLESFTRRRARRAAGSPRGDGGARVGGFGGGRGRRAGREDGPRGHGARTTRDPGWYEDPNGNRWYVDGDGRQWRVGPGAVGGRRGRDGPRAAGGGRTRPPGRDDHRGIDERTARERLGVDADADEAAVTAAYREKVKEVHPDAEDGDAEAFKRVTEAYERLVE